MIEKFVDAVLLVFVVVITAGIALLFVWEAKDYASPNDYTYVDLGGNAGLADVCNKDKSGMWCKSGDRQILVREYKANKEEE